MLRNYLLLYNKKEFLYNYVTDLTLPPTVERILSLGPKFSLPLTLKDINIPDIISDVEECINSSCHSQTTKETIRGKGINILTNIYYEAKYGNVLPQNKELMKDITICKRFLKQHPEIIVCKSDKGNSTVIMNKV